MLDRVPVRQADFDWLALAAFRYALGRQSYAVGLIANLLTDHAEHLSQSTKALICKEIDEAIGRGWAGDRCDERAWFDAKAALAVPA